VPRGCFSQHFLFHVRARKITHIKRIHKNWWNLLKGFFATMLFSDDDDDNVCYLHEWMINIWVCLRPALNEQAIKTKCEIFSSSMISRMIFFIISFIKNGKFGKLLGFTHTHTHSFCGSLWFLLLRHKI
jgi:hypothetical protein